MKFATHLLTLTVLSTITLASSQTFNPMSSIKDLIKMYKKKGYPPLKDFIKYSDNNWPDVEWPRDSEQSGILY